MRFTVRRPASAEVSPCCHRPSGGNIACGVHVGIARPRAAGDALENRLALTVFRRDMPAGRASLRRVDGVEAARHIGGGLFHPVTAAIRFPGAQPGNSPLRSCPPVRSTLRPGQTLLQSAQSVSFTSTKARNTQQLPAGQRRRHGQAAINTYRAAVTGSRDRFGDGGKSDVPAPRSIQCGAVGLHRVRDVAGPSESHPANFGDPDLSVAAAEPLEVAWFDADPPEAFVRAGLAPRRAAVGAVEEVTHRLGEVPQRLLLDGLRSGCQPVVFGAGRGQLGTLLVVTGRLAARLPMRLLLYGQIPHKTSVPTLFDQHCRLLNARKQPKPAHTRGIDTSTDNTSKGGARRFLPGLQPRVSTPQVR